ncbi:MAG: DUF6596 domain-containing protein [Burkholderiaceae bacterium]
MLPEAPLSRASEPTDAGQAAEAVARRSYGKLVAFLSARTRDVAGAEDALSDAFAKALELWRRDGIPENPEAWLLVVARRKMIDSLRRRRQDQAYLDDQALLAEFGSEEDEPPAIPDERLSLMFVCAHPAIERSTRAPLILQTTLGFDAATIASAFLVAPATMSQRLVRAKNKIRQAAIAFRVPDPADWVERLDAVLEATYAAFAEGWADPSLAETHRRNLSKEGIWLGRLLASLLPEEPEVLGLLALMLHAEARRAARRSAQGDYVPLVEQDTRLWDLGLIGEAEALLVRASRKQSPGRYQLEAAVQSAHAARRQSGRTDWGAIGLLYDALFSLTGSPVIAINRAVAIGQIRGPKAGLAALDEVARDPRLAAYQPYWAARAELLARLGEATMARQAFQQAIGLETDPAVRRFLLQRSSHLGR